MVLVYEPAGVVPVMPARKHRVVACTFTGTVSEAYDWKAVVSAVAFAVAVSVVQAVGLQAAMVFAAPVVSELEAPNSAEFTGMVPPVVSGIVSEPEVRVLLYFTIEM